MLPTLDAVPDGSPARPLRGLALGALVVVLFWVALLTWNEYPFGLGSEPALPTYLWTDPYETPASYSFEAETDQGPIRVWAVAPQKWRLEDRGERIQVSNGDEVWQYLSQQDVYYSIPFQHMVDAGVEPPRLQDGRPIIHYGNDWVSTRRPLAAYLGPIFPESLKSTVEYAAKYGWWSISEGTYLGRPVVILETVVEEVPRDVEGGPFHSTFTIDREYLFVLAHESREDYGDRERVLVMKMTRLSYNVEIPDSVFEFEPPTGAVQCLPPQFMDRGQDCMGR